ncbi:hypothetical protein [Dyadobacter sp. CY323]|uniref:hypothetical protein n=1 Tax=Dyadobacter sp. CY323 TaxID=2907302 RepID=UPI001F26F269|nr:hypothetical protein [Dyadobacter sp. CY323]MCE6988632.1 hypothetical protein [Dyadobacter sp. CY323]
MDKSNGYEDNVATFILRRCQGSIQGAIEYSKTSKKSTLALHVAPLNKKGPDFSRPFLCSESNAMLKIA